MCTKKKQFVLHEWIVPIYGQNWQFAKPTDTSLLLDKVGKHWVQSNVGSFL